MVGRKQEVRGIALGFLQKNYEPRRDAPKLNTIVLNLSEKRSIPTAGKKLVGWAHYGGFVRSPMRGQSLREKRLR